MKSRKYLFIILIMIVCFISFFLLIKGEAKSDSYKITSIKTAYNILSTIEEEDEIMIPLYSNTKKSDVIQSSKISKCMLCDKDEENVFKLKLKAIKEGDNILSISGEEFYEYDYYFTFVTNFNDEIVSNIDKVYLKLELAEKEIKMMIGSLSYYKVLSYSDDYNFMDLVCLKAIVNEIDENKSIVGVVMGLRNNTDKELNINNISLLDINLKTSLSEIKVIEDVPNSTDNISTLLGYEYDYLYLNDINSLDIKISSQDTKYLLIPLKKVGEISTNRFGLKIDYNYQGKDKSYYIDDFLYFKSNQKFKKENFDIITYENN